MLLHRRKVDILLNRLNDVRFSVWLTVFILMNAVSFLPLDPTYVVAPVLQSRSGREDLKKLFAGSILGLIFTVFGPHKAMLKFISEYV